MSQIAILHIINFVINMHLETKIIIEIKGIIKRISINYIKVLYSYANMKNDCKKGTKLVKFMKVSI